MKFGCEAASWLSHPIGDDLSRSFKASETFNATASYLASAMIARQSTWALCGTILAGLASSLIIRDESNVGQSNITGIANSTTTQVSVTAGQPIQTSFRHDEEHFGKVRGLSLYMSVILTLQAIAKDALSDGPQIMSFRFDKYDDVSIDITSYSTSGDVPSPQKWALAGVYTILDIMTKGNSLVGGVAIMRSGETRLGMIMVRKFSGEAEQQVQELDDNESDALVTPATSRKGRKRSLMNQNIEDYTKTFQRLTDESTNTSSASTLSQISSLGGHYYINFYGHSIPIGLFFCNLAFGMSIYGVLDLMKKAETFDSRVDPYNIRLTIDQWVGTDTPEKPEFMTVWNVVKSLRKIAEYAVEKRTFEDLVLVIEARKDVPVGSIRILKMDTET